MSFQVAFQGMKVVSWCIHVFGLARYIQSRKQSSQPFSIFRLNARFGPGFSELLQSLVPVAQDHYIVYSLAIRLAIVP